MKIDDLVTIVQILQNKIEYQLEKFEQQIGDLKVVVKDLDKRVAKLEEAAREAGLFDERQP